MKVIENKKFFFVSFLCFLFVCVFMSGFFIFQKNKINKEINKDKDTAIYEEQRDTSRREELEIEIVDDNGEKTTDTQKESEIEEILEDDAESLVVHEESEKTDAKEGVSDDNMLKLSTPLSPPEKRKNDPDTLRIGFITDLHVRSVNGKGNVLDNFYAKKILYFVERMNNVFVPDFILLNGDIIEGTRMSSEIGSKELSLVKDMVDRTNIKKYWVAGNHDLRSVSKKQWMKTLDIDYMWKSFDVGRYKLVILDGNFTKEDSDVGPGIDYTRGKVSQRQIEWLKDELEKAKDKKVIVFMHYPPLRDIDAEINSALLYNVRELQSIFSEYGVLAVFSGHIEDLYYQEIGGVKYFVSPGMVKYPKYTGAFSEITIKGDRINIVLNYLLANGKYQSVDIE